MPGMDGYETAQIIRSREQTKRIPIVFLSAVNKETEHLMRGYSMGAVDYVFKPVDPVVLRSKVAVFVDLFAMTPRDPAQGAAGAGVARREPARQCRATPGRAGAAPRRAAPGGDHPVAADRPLSRGDRAEPRAPKFVSGNFSALTGYRLRGDPALARPVDRAAPSRGSGTRRGGARRPAGGPSLAVEYRWQCADGQISAISSTRRCCCKDAEGNPIEYAGTLLDVTDRKELESQLLQARKMDAIGKLTGGIAHDFNNLLAAVLGGLGLIERRLPLEEEHRKILGMTRRAAEQGSELVGRLLAFARRQQLQPAAIEIGRSRPRSPICSPIRWAGWSSSTGRSATDCGAPSPTRPSSSSP